MRIIALSTLKAFWTRTPTYRDAEEPTLAWHRQAIAADWSHPADVKATLGTASILQDGRVVFNLAGNEYRLIVWIDYDYHIVYVRFIGTHRQYDKIDVQDI
jgi:mRNA interferase HigB